VNGTAVQRETLVETVAELRRAFDQSFAIPAPGRGGGVETFLTLQTAGVELALRLTDLVRLEGRRKVVALPAENPGLLGLAGIQGRLVPVYDLASLLGLAQDSPAWHWIALCAGSDAIGLAFETLHGYLRVSRANVGPADGTGPEREPFLQAVRDGENLWQVVHVPSLIATVRRRAGGLQGIAPET
jgi:chemotaxis signal transduction protein